MVPHDRVENARNVDALADALLNPRDRAYSVSQLIDFIERNGMMAGRWYWQAPYLPVCGAIASTPHRQRLAALPLREQYAAMELWRGTMTAHSVVVHRSDAGEPGCPVRFDDERWRRFVPLRVPWTLLIQERLPPGAAGALLNKSHQFHDLVVIIDEHDKRVFNNIDGRRPIAEILKDVREIDDGRARALFETLWNYDQVVFDTSHA